MAASPGRWTRANLRHVATLVRQSRNPAARVYESIGSTFFLASDSVLAIDRFAHRFAAAHGIVMVTYYLAQLLIAASVLATTT